MSLCPLSVAGEKYNVFLTRIQERVVIRPIMVLFNAMCQRQKPYLWLKTVTLVIGAVILVHNLHIVDENY